MLFRCMVSSACKYSSSVAIQTTRRRFGCYFNSINHYNFLTRAPLVLHSTHALVERSAVLPSKVSLLSLLSARYISLTHMTTCTNTSATDMTSSNANIIKERVNDKSALENVTDVQSKSDSIANNDNDNNNNNNNNDNNNLEVTNEEVSAIDSSTPPESTSWMTAAAWASLSSEFHTVSEDKFLRFTPESFLTPRAITSIAPAEQLMSELVVENEQRYHGIDVRDPSSLAAYEGERPHWLTRGGQVRAVEEFISGHLCHHVSLPEWKTLFDLQYIEMELTYWLYIIHLHLINRRATSVPIAKFSRRREIMHDLLKTMFDSWAYTSEEVMGRRPLAKIKMHIQDMYYVTALNLEEALLHDGPGADLMLMGFLMKFCPLLRPEDVPLYTYYTLVHYIRFHIALLDRISDETFAKGNFNFLSPTDSRIFEPYSEIDYDTIIRQWTVDDNGNGNGNDSNTTYK